MNVRHLFCKTLPAAAAAFFMVSAGIIFTLKYVHAAAELLPYFDNIPADNCRLFYLNFYIPFAFCFLSLCGCLFLKGFFLRGICLVAGFTTAVIAGYVLSDLFTVNLCIYSAYVLIGAAAFDPPGNYCVSGFAIICFIIFLFRPPFLGPAYGNLSYFIPSADQVILLVLYMSLLAAAMFSIRYLAEKYNDSESAIAHLNQVGTKMLLFNHRLQEYVKDSGEEAVKKDRLRFTSDLHDSSGYVFTNIIAITDAALSWPSMEMQKMQETFKLIQNQARNGLNRTREILHMIRGLQDPAPGSIDTIYEMKAILEEVTDIKVDIETGNMRYNYDSDVNRALTRIIQEAFTNSIRHGKASRILINFWEFPDSLEMTVRDNGMGAQNIVRGIGLAGMEERLEKLNGTLEVSSPADGGFCLKVTIPLVTAK
jgi:signal transduction histidine kinase